MANETPRSVELDYMDQLLRADPQFPASMRRLPEYEFTGRTFYADRNRRPPYDQQARYGVPAADIAASCALTSSVSLLASNVLLRASFVGVVA